MTTEQICNLQDMNDTLTRSSNDDIDQQLEYVKQKFKNFNTQFVANEKHSKSLNDLEGSEGEKTIAFSTIFKSPSKIKNKISSSHLTKNVQNLKGPKDEQKNASPLTKPERRLCTNDKTQSWMLALLVYNTCVAPISSYCANSIFEYGVDVAKYNMASLFFKYMMKEVIV